MQYESQLFATLLGGSETHNPLSLKHANHLINPSTITNS
jgi:hypothetical protein